MIQKVFPLTNSLTKGRYSGATHSIVNQWSACFDYNSMWNSPSRVSRIQLLCYLYLMYQHPLIRRQHSLVPKQRTMPTWTVECLYFSLYHIVRFVNAVEKEYLLLVGNRRDKGRPKNEYPFALNTLDLIYYRLGGVVHPYSYNIVLLNFMSSKN